MRKYNTCRCAICKKEFTARSSNQKYCSAECRKIIVKLNRAKKRKHIVHTDNLTEIQKKAWELGMSYGQYVAMQYK